MKWFNIFIARLRGTLRRESVIRDIDEELRSHIEMETETNIEKGMTPEAARQAALRSFGNLGRVKDVAYDARGGGIMETVWQDLRYGIRTLRQNPGFTATAVMALSLGIGATTAIFSVVQAVLLRKLPYPEPDRIVMVWSQNPAVSRETKLPNTPGEYNLWREQGSLFEAVALFDSTRFNLTGDFDAFKVGGALVTREFFAAFGVTPYLGRTFTESEEQPGNEQVAVISYNLWASHFGGDRQILGKPIQFSGRNFRIVGVMPQWFHFPYQNELPKDYWFDPTSDVWTPLALGPQAAKNFRARSFLAVARLRSGVSFEGAQAKLSAINARVQAEYSESKGWGVKALRLHDQAVGGVKGPITLLFMAVSLVLAIACVNVANLLLARSSTRWREMSLRAALGAGRGRLARQLLTESLTLSLLGGAFGILLAWWGVSLLVKLSPADIPRLGEIKINLTVLAFTLAVSIVTGLLFGLAPALRMSRPNLTTTLSEDPTRGGETPRARRFKGLLTAAQVALAITLLTGAGLLLRSFRKVVAVDLGYEKGAVLTFGMDIPGIKYRDGSSEIQVLLDRIFSLLDSLPGVESAPRPQIYFPNTQVGFGDLQLVIRTSRDLDSTADLVRKEIGRIDKLITISNARPLEQLFDQAIASRRFHTRLLILFAACALALALTGLYGLMAYAVAQRTHEIGVRMALGARRVDILLDVIRKGMRWVVIGTGVGLFLSYVLGRLLASLLFEVSATDPMTLGGVAGLMLLVGFAANYFPARRAARVDPVTALKYE